MGAVCTGRGRAGRRGNETTVWDILELRSTNGAFERYNIDISRRRGKNKCVWCTSGYVPIEVLGGPRGDQAVGVGEVGEDAHVAAILEFAAGRHLLLLAVGCRNNDERVI